MINLDTDNLKECSKASNLAFQELNDASSLLLQITQHQDWICPNKDKINQLIESNRTMIQNLVNDANSFDSAIQSVTDDFISQESNISSMFEELETLLSGILSVETVSSGVISSLGAAVAGNAGAAISQISVASAETLFSGFEGNGE